MSDLSNESSRESALAFLKPYESRMAWDASSRMLVVNGFVPPERTSTVADALMELGHRSYMSTGDTLRYPDLDVVYQLLHAGFRIQGQETVPGVTADHIPMTRQKALEVLKPFEKQMRWEAKREKLHINGFPVSLPSIYAKPAKEWPPELEACWTLMPNSEHYDRSGVKGISFVGRELAEALATAGFEFEGSEEIFPPKTPEQERKDQAIKLLRQYSDDMEWDRTRSTFTFKNPHHEGVEFDRWGTLKDVCWGLVGADHCVSADDEVLAFNNTDLPILLRDAGVRFEGSDDLPGKGPAR